MNEVNRRGFLAGMSALGVSAFLPGCATTDSAGTKTHRIDVHHHFISPGYSAALKQGGLGHAKWSV